MINMRAIAPMERLALQVAFHCNRKAERMGKCEERIVHNYFLILPHANPLLYYLPLLESLERKMLKFLASFASGCAHGMSSSQQE